jgi:hypothetical protein
MTGEQVAEWASNSCIPAKFAYVSVALARWFNNALLIPEANYSASYMKIVVEQIGYENVYMRKVDIVGINKVTQKPGFWMTNDDVKLRVFESMQEAMAEGSFLPRSVEMLKECPEYEWRNGRVVHVGSAKSADDSNKGKAHGDRVIAACIAWMGCVEDPVIIDDDDHPAIVPDGSMAQRLKLHDEEMGNIGDPWEMAGVDIFGGDFTVARDDWS